MSKAATIHLDLAARRYRQMRNPSALRDWLALAYGPTETMYDPVKAYIETVYPDITVQSGMVEVDFYYRGDRKLMASETIHPWHDRHLSRVVSRASKVSQMDEADPFPTICQDCDGYFVKGGEYVATVEAHLSALTPEPLAWFGKLFLSVLSVPDALRGAFSRR